MGNVLIKIKKARKFKNAIKFQTFDFDLENNDPCSDISSNSSKVESNYIIPNKFEESERVKRKHFVLKHIFERNFSAPVHDLLTNGCRVLDVGCGPGTWILDMASEYTRSSFVGLDIFPMFPSEIKPNNTDFVMEDVRNNLPFESNYFDYIFLGDMGFCFTDYEFDCVVTECRRILKPGGWIEFQESSRKLTNRGPCIEKFGSMAHKIFESKKIKTTHYSQNDLKKVPNITNINEDVKPIPLGSWGGKLGEEYQEVMVTALLLITKPIAEMYNCSWEEMRKLIDNMQLEMSELKSSHDFVRTFGQKEYSEND
ncbi:hypothetical protein Glove_21g368 [Diversispora epigaea]|uniref:Methyltransferase domain-containing protein n=1 Tax=Diversispora epigaea TaxID=1348612 RepID=A0A397JWH4_9GLOM|nr:hypothetical protein Glove_21g368 [Diversispora epigaea]